MRSVVVAIGVGFVAAAALRAEEPQVEFARGLRQRGMADLAVDYLQRLGDHAPERLKAILPLEIAKARLDLVAAEGNEKKRAKLFDEARAAFDQFLKASPSPPLAADAAVEVARLIALQGKYLLAQARRVEDAPTRRDLIVRARPLFADAATKLASATQQIDAVLSRLASPQNADEQAQKTQLQEAKLQADLESGINLVNVALTMPDNTAGELKARAAEIVKARTALETLATAGDDKPAYWSARVWIGRCADELDNKAEARRIWEALAAEKNPAAEEAARMASLLALRAVAEDRQNPSRAEQVRTAIAGLEDWVKKNRGTASSADAQTARYLLAVLLEEQFQTVSGKERAPGPPRLTGASRAQLQRIERLFKEVIDGEGDYAERARRRRAEIQVALLGDRATGDLDRLLNFEECYIAAQIAAYEVTQGKKSEAEKTALYTRIAAALRRGLGLVGRADSPRDVGDARAMLTYTYLAAGDPYSAAVYGEFVGKSNSAGSRSAESAAYALQGYSAILTLDRSRNDSDEDTKADLRRLRALAEFMETTWPDEPATEFARHQLGSLLLEDRHYVEACAMLARIGATYPGVAQARYQLGAAAQRAQTPDVSLPAEQKQALLKQAIASLESLPDPAPGRDEDSTLALCMAKCQLGNLYLYDESATGANFVKVAELGKTLAALAPSLNLDAKVRPQVQVEAAKLVLAGAQNRAYRLMQADQLEACRLVLKPIYERVRGEITAATPPEYVSEPWYEGYREVQRQVVALRLRLAIQENETEAAHQALATLQKASGQLESANDRLLRLVYDLKREADEFKKKGETEKRERLERGLSAFLDELARPTNLPPDVRLFLAQAFGGLDRHDRAAELLAGYPAPPANATEEAKTRFQSVRLMLAREHRLAKQFDPAKTVLQEILGSWGKSDLSVRREKIFLLEDAGNYGAAVQECREIKRGLQASRQEFERAARDEAAAEAAERTAANDADRQKAAQDHATAQVRKGASQSLRDRFWEFDFYDTRIVLRSALKVNDPAAREQKIAAVAANIKRLEDAHPEIVGKELREKYLELFEIEPLLKQKYSDAAGKVLITS